MSINLWCSEFTQETLPTPTASEPRLVHWIPSVVGTIKVNVDGGCNGSNGLCGVGGYCATAIGNGYQGFLPKWFGVRMTLKKQSIFVSPFNSSIPSLCIDRYFLLRQNWNCHLSHGLHEGNTCDDLLAKFSINQTEDLMVWQVPLAFINSALLANSFEVSLRK
ncbi:hypothetical protein VNO78_00485 [Psophocarpus tetragonolobus]|uniref:RNase H type-1 domain-containing protein n=1 Tax=Psophocarpus tetragonolobus TaxID=3891 RepID=A0AAN9SY44_PSOTE